MIVFIGYWLGDWFGHDLILYFVATYQLIAFYISFQQRNRHSNDIAY